MRHYIARLTLSAVLGCVPGQIDGQVVPDSLVNQRVRVHLTQDNPALERPAGRQALRGIILRTTSDSVVMYLHPAAAPVTVAADGIYQVDVSRGLRPGRTAVRRGIEGALIWGFLGSTGPEKIRNGPLENALVWAGGGFVVGAVLGVIFPEEHWIRVFRR